MAVTFDGEALIMVLDPPTAGVLNQTAEQIYDDAKQWHLNANNRKYPFPFTTSGGEVITSTQDAGEYYFIRNDLGWRIQTSDESQNVFLDGNLIPTDLLLPIVIARPGRTIAVIGLQPITVGVRAIGADALLARELLEADQVFDESAKLLHYFRKGTVVDLIPAKTVVTTQTQDTSLVE